MPELITPTVRLRESWLASRDEWGRDVHQDGAGLRAGDVVDSVAGFARWVGRLLRQADTSRPVSEDRVHASYWWIAEDGTYLGAITLRHELNDFLLRAAGHIGYGIRPSARGRGLATWALRSVLVRAPALGLRKVLVTCGDSNLASARVIEKAGGVLEDVHDTELGLTRPLLDHPVNAVPRGRPQAASAAATAQGHPPGPTATSNQQEPGDA